MVLCSPVVISPAAEVTQDSQSSSVAGRYCLSERQKPAAAMGSLACVKQPLLLIQGAKQRQQRGALKPLRFHSQDAMACSSQPCLCLWKSVPVLSGGWCLQICSGLLFFDFMKVRKHTRKKRMHTRKKRIHTTKKGSEQVYSEEIFCLGAHRRFWKGWECQQTMNANLKASLVAFCVSGACSAPPHPHG